METAPFNIRVVHISPGGVRTNINANALSQLSLREDSLYKPWFDSIISRLTRMRSASSLSAEAFAQRVVRQVLKPTPPRYMTLGTGATASAILQGFPRAFVCWLMWRLVAGKVKVT